MDFMSVLAIFLAPVIVYIIFRVASAGYFRSRLNYDERKPITSYDQLEDKDNGKEI